MSNRVLVVHPRDPTTDFLVPIYSRLDATVITKAIPQHRIRGLMENFDQLMFMGHGSPWGLMSVGQFPGGGFIINDSFRAQLAERDNTVYVWCYADQFVHYNNLRGFYTGMFVSDMMEARMCGLPFVDKWEVDVSNRAFADVVGRFAGREPRILHAAVKHEYGRLATYNPVAEYNLTRLGLASNKELEDGSDYEGAAEGDGWPASACGQGVSIGTNGAQAWPTGGSRKVALNHLSRSKPLPAAGSAAVWGATSSPAPARKHRRPAAGLRV